MNYLLIGASAACVSAAHTIARREPTALITLVTEQQEPPNNTCVIKYVLDGSKNKKDIFLPLPSRAVVHIKQRIVDINPKEKYVTSDTGAIFFYETLIIGTGSKPRWLDISTPYKGEGVFTYHTLDDVEHITYFIEQRMHPAFHVVVIGAGLSGIEAAIALRIRGVRVSLIEKGVKIAAHEESSIQHAMAELMTVHGIKLYCSTEPLALHTDDTLFVLETTHGPLKADMILLAAGCVADNQWLSPVCSFDQQGYITQVHEAYRNEIAIAGDCRSQARVRNGWARALMQGKGIFTEQI